MATIDEALPYVRERGEELAHVLAESAVRYHALAPEIPLDQMAEYLVIEATFEQVWGSTTGGFGGIGGQMITGSQTWVIRSDLARAILVYFGARLAHATDDYEWARKHIQARRFPPASVPPVRPGDPLPIRHAPDPTE